MFPLTHALVAQNLVKNNRSRAIIGGVFPDLANVIGIHRNVTHEMGHDFYRFCHENDKDFLDFAQAVISHGANPPGLDYYADQSYQEKEPGYCFQRAAPLVDQVIKACAIPPQMGLWKAHNFIEMAFDVISVELFPALPDQFETALKDEGMLKNCSDLLGRYFHIDGGKVKDAFRKMPEYFCLRDVTPVNLAEKYAVQLKKRHGVLGADPQGIAEVVQEARKIVEGEFSSFLHDAVEKMSRLLLNYPIINQD